MATPSPAKKARKESQSRHGPQFVRNAIIKLSDLSTNDPATGWREPSDARVEVLKGEFLAGNFGMTVACGVTVLEKEDADGKKLIDDGVSTVLALVTCQAYFAGETEQLPPANLKEVFDLGLHVRVMKYPDDDDREARECWNIARHDEESFTVRWSSLHQKIGMAFTYFRRLGTWAAAAAAMVDFYGEGKRTTVGRWTRAAKGMDAETVALLKQFPEMKGAFLWDNSYLVASATRARDKMSPTFARMALQLLVEHADDLSASAFTDKVCKPMRVLQVWQTLMIKRYGSVASNSPALERLVLRLASWGGLGNVRACIESGVVLHDPKGIPECHLLSGEFDKCKAGGLPPPTRIPSEADAKAAEQAAAEAAAAAAQEREEQLRLEQAQKEAADRDSREAEYAAEADLLLMTASTGTGAGGISQPARSSEEIACDAVAARLRKVHFFDPTDAFIDHLAALDKPFARSICLVEAPTTHPTSFGHFMELAAKAFGALNGSHNRLTGTNLTKFRLVVLVGTRFDLIAKALDKIKTSLPTWSSMVVQLQRRDRQSDRVRPTYAVVAAPVGELTATEPTVMALPRSSAKEAVRLGISMRCTESQCHWRPEATRTSIADEAHEDTACEIDKDDKVDLVDAMLDDTGDAADMDDEQDGDQPGGDESSCRRDAIVDLWPYARDIQYYVEILTLLGVALKADTVAIMSTTAHPSHWLACEKLGLLTWVLTRRWSDHSSGHGLALGKQIILKEESKPTPCPKADPQPHPMQFIEASIKLGCESQLVEAYDVVQGSEWNDGVNRSVPPQVLVPGSQALVRKEAELHQVRVTSVLPDKGRGIETIVAKREGEVVCDASALFFDDYDTVMAVITANPRFSDRVCRIDGVHRGGEKVTIYAILLGIAQFIQHYTGFRSRHNSILEFDPSHGFNAGCLKVVASTRTGVGIAAGSPVLLNYGTSYGFSAQQKHQSDDAYYGALDALFDSQKRMLPTEAEQNKKKAAEEAAAKETAAAEAKDAEAAAVSAAAQKAAEEALAAEAQRKAEEEKQKQEAELNARKKAEEDKAKGNPEPHAVVSTVAGHTAELVLIDGNLHLKNTSQTNKKLPVDTVLAAWSTSCALSSQVDGPEYKLTFKSDIVDKTTMKRLKLDKYIKDRIQQTTEIFGYEPFPAGSAPKVLNKKGSKVLKWEYTGSDHAVVKQALEAARTSTTVLLAFIVKHVPAKGRVEPCGMCLVLPKATLLPGGGILQLK